MTKPVSELIFCFSPWDEQNTPFTSMWGCFPTVTDHNNLLHCDALQTEEYRQEAWNKFVADVVSKYQGEDRDLVSYPEVQKHYIAALVSQMAEYEDEVIAQNMHRHTYNVLVPWCVGDQAPR